MLSLILAIIIVIHTNCFIDEQKHTKAAAMYIPPASPNSLLLRSNDVRELLFFKASMKYWASLSQSWLPWKQRQI